MASPIKNLQNPTTSSFHNVHIYPMEGGELVFVATPAMGHMVALVELAKNLVAHNPTISVSILVLKLPITNPDLDSYIQSTIPSFGDGRISFLVLPPLENPPKPEEYSSKSLFPFILSLFADLYKPIVKQVVANRSRRVLGIISDMLVPQFSDAADELGIPSYILYTSGVHTLAMTLKIESLGVDVPSTFGNLPPESTPLEVSGFRNLIPINVWPKIVLSKEISALGMSHASKYRETKGILVNTFAELDSEILLSLSSDDRIPPVYTVGPVLDLGRREIKGGDHPILSWLDAQPPASVVFLCFGSIGSFPKEQVEEIVVGIEQSGYRFLWSLRRQPNSDKGERVPTDYEDYGEILPAGFLDRTKGIGKMIGWAPQVEVLAHPAVGAFVSHCGWNSVLESLRFGVPMVTWPMYAEQQLNAFYMVKELGIAVELRNDYIYNMVDNKGNVVVSAAEVEKGIRKMMEEEEGVAVRNKIKKMSEFAKKALDVGGSSHKSLQLFTRDLIKNLLLK